MVLSFDVERRSVGREKSKMGPVTKLWFESFEKLIRGHEGPAALDADSRGGFGGNLDKVKWSIQTRGKTRSIPTVATAKSGRRSS